ncbi:ABC transporter substrate-binding protein, partial [Streptomyces lavendulocolor]
LVKNRDSLDRTLALAGPYYRLVGNTLGNASGPEGPETERLPPRAFTAAGRGKAV